MEAFGTFWTNGQIPSHAVYGREIWSTFPSTAETQYSSLLGHRKCSILRCSQSSNKLILTVPSSPQRRKFTTKAKKWPNIHASLMCTAPIIAKRQSTPKLHTLGAQAHWSLHAKWMADFIWNYIKRTANAKWDGQHWTPFALQNQTCTVIRSKHWSKLVTWITAVQWTLYNHQVPPPNHQMSYIVNFNNYILQKSLTQYQNRKLMYLSWKLMHAISKYHDSFITESVVPNKSA